jgi:transaldolase
MTATENRRPMADLAEAGQAVWLDYIRRDLLEGGELGRLVAEGLRGVTSNPSIFEQAIGRSELYDGDIAGFVTAHPGAAPAEVFEHLALADIRAAADVLRPVHDDTGGRDGFISLEVDPGLAHDTEGTIAEARRLWAAVFRPNLMIKVPATPAGLPAIEALIGDGVNVNVTLIFSLAQYEAVAQAFLAGLARCDDPSKVASVASVFVSRIDSAVDALLEELGSEEALALRGRTAVANAKVVHRRFGELFGDDFEAEWGRGVAPQRPLWASTSTKNPTYPDLLYVEPLVGPDTVNTMPPATLEAFLDHGAVVADTVSDGLDDADRVLAELARLGIDLEAVCDRLRSDGVTAFADAFGSLLDAIDAKASALADR